MPTKAAAIKPFKVMTEVPAQRVANTLVSGIEGGIGYWAQIGNEKGPGYNSTTCDRIVAGKAHLLLTEVDDTMGKHLVLNRSAVEMGLTVMAEKYPKHFADMVSENDDATTGDVLVQCALLGEVVYG